MKAESQKTWMTKLSLATCAVVVVVIVLAAIGIAMFRSSDHHDARMTPINGGAAGGGVVGR